MPRALSTTPFAQHTGEFAAIETGKQVNHYQAIDQTDVSDLEESHFRPKLWLGSVAAMALLVAAGIWGVDYFAPDTLPAAKSPSVAVSAPLQRQVDQRLLFLGQLAAAKQVEVRAQVGGTLKGIYFKDGDVVRQGQVLFEIDPEPYQIKHAQTLAELKAAQARLGLATRELARAQQLESVDAGSIETVEQKQAEKLSAQAAVEGASAAVRDARFDLDRTRVRAPFTGRIGTHQVSAGNLVAGSRAGNAQTTLLATLVSLDPVWVNFDMSEADYMTFQHARAKAPGPIANRVHVSLGNAANFGREGKLEFVDNALDRGSGTIRARATLKNVDGLLTPGAFARVRLALSATSTVLLVPDAAVLPDQADHVVLTLDKDEKVRPKQVKLGDLRGGLRVIRSGLAPTDRVIIDGIPLATPGSKVTPHRGKIQFEADKD